MTDLFNSKITMFNNPFKKKNKTADELLSTGEINWRLKPIINALENFPNLLKFITMYEDKNNLQMGLVSDSIDNYGNQVCIFQQIIYAENNNPALMFHFGFIYVNITDKHIAFIGYIANFFKIEEQSYPDPKYYANIPTTKNSDMSIDEYEKYYEEAYAKAISIRLLDKNKYRRVRGNGLQCMFKTLEQEKREKFSNS
ncbi:MAG: hypothetical protein GXX85_04960 [Ignavibacteria bacterium]|nr:hypothetical protein [Ignavibacteria bacterium]